MREKGMRDYFSNIPGVVVKETITSNDDVYYATKLAESSINADQPDVIIGLNFYGIGIKTFFQIYKNEV